MTNSSTISPDAVTFGNIAAEMAIRPWRTSRLPDLVGSKETCEILGIQKMTLTRWLKPGTGPWGPDGQYGPNGTYMIPPKYIAAGPVWVKSDVERFAEEIGRQRARSQAADSDTNAA